MASTFNSTLLVITDICTQPDLVRRYTQSYFDLFIIRAIIKNVFNYPAETFSYKCNEFSVDAKCTECEITIDIIPPKPIGLKTFRTSLDAFIGELREKQKNIEPEYDVEYYNTDE